MNTLAAYFPAPTTWGLIVAVVVIAAIIYLAGPKLPRVLRGILIAVAVILFVLWVVALLPGDKSLP